jgi:hypothetical protein
VAGHIFTLRGVKGLLYNGGEIDVFSGWSFFFVLGIIASV